MDEGVRRWVREVVDQYDLADKRTLEIGSYDVNGTCRDYFTGEYIGVDMRDGPGVDRVASGALLPWSDEEFDVVLNLECMEHDLSFWLTLHETDRLLRPGGYAVLTTRGILYGRHDYPSDYYRFTDAAIEGLMGAMGWEILFVSEDMERTLSTRGVYGLGRKP